jgi:uncharacterized protein (TIGR03118 family)
MKTHFLQTNGKPGPIAAIFATTLRRSASFGVIAILVLSATTSWSAGGPKNSYTKTNLVSDVPGRAAFTDPNLVNPWGLTIGNEFWVSNNGTGTSTLYGLDGEPFPLVVTIPPSASNTEGISAPTGQVFNPGSNFVVSNGTTSGPAIFIFVSEDGGISGWSPSVDVNNAILAVDHGAEGAIYKGFAISDSLDRLYATDFHNGKVEVYDQNFNEIDNQSTFVDPGLPAGYAPFGIQSINGSIYVTYALQAANKVDDVPGPGHGFVSVFDTDGNFIQRLISHKPLNSPWGLALAPAGFGKASGSLLVGNFGNGRINTFDLNTGASRGPLRKANGAPIAISGLWALLFVDTDLYITAGPDGEAHGLFAKIQADQP